MSVPSNILVTYKRLLTLAKRLPASDRDNAISQIRSAFRQNRDETREDKIKELMAVATSKLGYLKIVTPKDPKEAFGGAKRYIVSDGHLLEASGMSRVPGKAVSDGSIDSDQIRRHQQNLRRFQFLDRGGPAPRGPFGI